MLSDGSASASTSAAVVSFDVTGVEVVVDTGGGDVAADGSKISLKGNIISKQIPKQWFFDNLPKSVVKALQDAAKDFTGISTNGLEKVAVGDAELSVNGLKDSLIVQGKLKR